MTWARWGMQPQPDAPLSLYVEVRFTKNVGFSNLVSGGID
ncbi:uncharacterized protein RAG0_05147 [Rhynchosporium agropyri]|uniref:Uncharacterized protein n=1 Tax=Rhynchosporium agropyri TaxID=914238 RepID=A0A1E1KBY5_9HELO|nr:uncharacterized protein RAG0_05147 [Rhynchosporium agropyri]